MKTKENKIRAAHLGKIDEELKSKRTMKMKPKWKCVSGKQKEKGKTVSDERVETNLA